MGAVNCSELCGSNWEALQQRISAKEFGKRLQSSWEMSITLAGFIAGFTYIVSIQVQEYEYETIGGTDIERESVFKIFVITAFILALSSTLLGMMLKGTLKFIGYESAGLLRERHTSLCAAPEKCVVASIIYMLISSMISIGGNVGPWLWTFCLVIGIIFFMLMLRTYYWILGNPEVKRIMELKMQEVPEENVSLNANS